MNSWQEHRFHLQSLIDQTRAIDSIGVAVNGTSVTGCQGGHVETFVHTLCKGRIPRPQWRQFTGTSEFDFASRAETLQELRSVAGEREAPFVRTFHAQPSVCLRGRQDIIACGEHSDARLAPSFASFLSLISASGTLILIDVDFEQGQWREGR